ncbi:helix-turn-helix domain-containing protein [Sphaerimonospora mesophila]|uniref:helix-turn-helix domain-containing protein n=1 Tax=Sphaerimonospora mesophila TaxID=37483 RepID=UPI0006E1CAA3
MFDRRELPHHTIRSTDAPIPDGTPYPSAEDEQAIADIRSKYPQWGPARIHAELCRVGRSHVSLDSVRLVVKS